MLFFFFAAVFGSAYHAYSMENAGKIMPDTFFFVVHLFFYRDCRAQQCIACWIIFFFVIFNFYPLYLYNMFPFFD